MNKTLFFYGAFGLFVLLQLMALAMMGGASEDLVKYMVLGNLVVFALVVFFDPFGLFCVLLAWFPFSFGALKFELGIVTFTPYTMGMVLLSILSVYLRWSKGERYSVTAIDYIIVLLCASFLFSTLTSKNIVQSGFFAFHALFIPVVSYFCVKNMIVDDAFYKQALLFLLIGVVLFAAVAISPLGKGVGRIVLFEMPPISIAAMMLWAIVALFVLGWIRTTSGILSFLIAATAFFKALSKGYFVLLLLTPIFNRMIRSGWAYQLMLSMLVLSFIGTLLLAISSSSFSYVDIKNTEDKSIERVTNIDHWTHSIVGRGYYYLDGLKQIPKNPIFGVGAYKGDGGVVRHNFHVEWLEYGGVTMFILYSLLFLTHFRVMGRYARNDVYIRANLVVIFTLLLNGVVNSFTVGTAPILCFILIGFSEARRRMYLRGELKVSDA